MTKKSKNVPERLIQEFDGDRHGKLRSVEKKLSNRDRRVSKQHYFYLKVMSNGELIGDEWLRIKEYDEIQVDSERTLTIDWYDLLVDKLGYTAGNYNIEYCVKANPIKPNEFVRVAEISKNKMEIRVDAIDEEALIEIRQPLIGGKYYAPLDLYYDETFIKAVAWAYDEHHPDENLVLKLADKLPRSIKVGDEIEIWDEIVSTKSLDLVIDIDVPKGLEPFTELLGPMVTLDVNAEVGKPTEFESWEKILTGSSDVNSTIISSVLSQSTGAELNIDYRDYKNFIHFSSARERLTNFEYKMKLVEYYDSKSAGHGNDLNTQVSSSVTGSSFYVSASTAFNSDKSNVIGSFDNYENYLYTISGSGETEDGKTYYSTTWPKRTNPSTPAFPAKINYSATSSQVQSWLTGSFVSASRHDEDNLNLLRRTIPAVQRSDPNNSGFVLFIDMIAQHFDILYNYIDNLNNQRVRDENLSSGISKDLLFDTLKSFGWKPKSGLDLEKIWEYWLGTSKSGATGGPGDATWAADNTGQYPAGAATSSAWSTEPTPKRDLELEPISRIINNLPYLLKTKGTTRGLKALLSCYGIPSSFFKIQEFGGPNPNRHDANVTSSHLREIDMQNHALQFQGGLHNQDDKVSFLSGSWDNADGIQTVEFRFKTQYQNSQSLFQTSQNPLDTANPRQQLFLIPSKSAGDPDTKYAFVKYTFADTGLNDNEHKSGSLGKLPILDNDWWNIALVNDDEGKKIKLICQKSPDHAHGNITHKDSIEIDYLDTDQSSGWGSGAVDTFYFGHKETINNTKFINSASNLDFFSGSLQELRFWACELDEDAIDLHTKAPTSIFGLSYSSSFSDLVYRLPLGTDNNIDHHTASVNTFTSTHPDQTKTGLSISTTYMSGSFEWEEEEETYFIQTPNSFGLRPVSNKIRIENNTINGMLDPFLSQESSSSDTNPIDLPDLYVSVSPQDDLDIDIGLQFGEVNMDNIVGDPREARDTNYSMLRKLRDDYFKKFSGVQKIQAYINTLRYINTALFQQIDSMLPARGTNVVGLMIKPTLLERSKVAFEPSFSYEQNQYLGKTGQAQQNLEHYTQSIDCMPDRYMADSDDYDAMEYVFTHDGTYASQWFSTLTDTVKTEAGTEPNKYSYNIATKDAITKNVRSTDFDGLALTMTVSSIMPFAYDQPTPKNYFKTHFFYSSSVSASLNKWYSSSFHPTQLVQQDEFAGFYNSFVAGCKMTSPDFNIASTDTIDGGPVVEFTEGNPNTLISDSPSLSGDLIVR